MSATIEQRHAVVGTRARPVISALPLWAVVLLSRAVIVVAGAAAVLSSRRDFGWSVYDPTRSTAHLGWLGNLLAASVDRWDSIHYLQIAQAGYARADNTPFYPLYPGLMSALGTVLHSDVIAGVVISCACFGIALVLLHRLVAEELGTDTANATILLLAFAPLSFFFTAVYTESLFLALSVGALYAARRGSWALASVLAAASTVTRVPGILVIVVVAYMWWHSDDRRWRTLAWFSIAPLSLVAYSVYLHAHGFAFLASISNESAAYHRTLAGPLETIWLSVRAAISTPAWARLLPAPFAVPVYNAELLLILLISVVTLAGAWRRLPRAYAIYATLALAVDLWSAFPGTPLRSFDRYTLVIFPLWIVAASWLQKRRLLFLVLSLEAVLLVYYVHQFALWGWVA